MSAVLKRLHGHHDHLLELIYHTAVDTRQWPVFMRRLVDLIDGRSARILFMDASASSVQNSFKVNIDDAYHQQYVDHFVNTCPWRPELAYKSKGRLYSTFLDFTCDQKGYHGTEFYNDWASPQGIEHGMLGTVAYRDNHTVQLLVQRTVEPGHFTRGEIAYVSTLVPHIRRALELRRRLDAEQTKRSLAQQAAEARTLPFLLLDSQLRVTYVSDCAKTVLDRHSELDIRNDRLFCSDPTLGARLRQLLLDTAAADRGAWDKAGGSLLAPDKRARVLELIVYPLHPAYHGVFATGDAHVVVYLNDETMAHRLDRRLIRARFKLTSAETELAESLINGVGLEEHAKRRRTSIHTVRTQSKTLLAKTGCSRQGQLLPKLFPYVYASVYASRS